MFSVGKDVLPRKRAVTLRNKVLFATLLLHTNTYNAVYDQKHKVKKGQLITGRVSLADKCCLTEKQVRGALDHLLAQGFIQREIINKGRPNSFSIITIKNFEELVTIEDKYVKITKWVQEKMEETKSKQQKNVAAKQCNKDCDNCSCNIKKLLDNIKNNKKKPNNNKPENKKSEARKMRANLFNSNYTISNLREIISDSKITQWKSLINRLNDKQYPKHSRLDFFIFSVFKLDSIIQANKYSDNKKFTLTLDKNTIDFIANEYINLLSKRSRIKNKERYLYKIKQLLRTKTVSQVNIISKLLDFMHQDTFNKLRVFLNRKRSALFHKQKKAENVKNKQEKTLLEDSISWFKKLKDEARKEVTSKIKELVKENKLYWNGSTSDIIFKGLVIEIYKDRHHANAT